MTVCTFFALATLLLSMGLDMFYSALPNFYMGLAFSGNCGRTFFFLFSLYHWNWNWNWWRTKELKKTKQSGEDMPNSYSATLLFKCTYHYDYKWCPIYSLTTNYHHINKCESNYTNIKKCGHEPHQIALLPQFDEFLHLLVQLLQLCRHSCIPHSSTNGRAGAPDGIARSRGPGSRCARSKLAQLLRLQR